ncbi:MAG: deoxyribose-phosphate aldolase [Clostridiales bacterium]|jgi:deoxyribose-phosphate aldolase|nr:deoxyribose-phosphate aldolase [Clostridiales bacterium]HOA34593.1 deoxyribose-phosphate aldolase [Clostridiales bacterium]HPP68974.1 deoxyribose-phosphate aldolase [Clostridiales bacterium]HPU66787.1 deoxyribose-phosphate aldolase [Clostridiales bacterium]HQA05807.1 deoxyribose-phosphate aldolase [Clostridiales bacterium]
MDIKEILSRVDHTILKPETVWEDVDRVCAEAVKYSVASVCIPPSFVRRARYHYPELNICTVVGFPNGYNSPFAKEFETILAVKDGADEIDMVINIGLVKEGRYDEVLSEILLIREACHGKILKVIIETCLLTEEEKIEMCKVVTKSGADYIKTSTGFGSGGATRRDILLFKEHIGDSVKIKAAGGIKSLEDAKDFIVLGADRLGTSSLVKLAEGLIVDSSY